MTTTTRMGLLGASGAACLAATIIAFHVLQPELDPTRHYVSEYAYGTGGWIFTVGYVAAGVGAFLSAWAFASAIAGWRAFAAAACLGLVGVGLVVTGVTRIDLAGANGTIVSTASGQAHELAGYIAILGLLPGSILAATALGHSGDPAAARWGWFLAAAAIIGFLAVMVAQRLDAVGVGQRIFLAAALAWFAWVGVHTARA